MNNTAIVAEKLTISMIETAEQLVEHVRTKIADFSALDQYSILQEVIQQLNEEADVQLRLEYMIKEDGDE